MDVTYSKSKDFNFKDKSFHKQFPQFCFPNTQFSQLVTTSVLLGSCVFSEDILPKCKQFKHSSKPTPFNTLAMSCTQHVAPCFFSLTASLGSVSLLPLIALPFHLEVIGGDRSCNGVLSRC